MSSDETARTHDHARMSRFLRMLVIFTAAIHVPFAVAAFALLRRLTDRSPSLVALVALASAAIGVIPIYLRARSGLYDDRKHDLRVRLIDIPYFVHWCACVFLFLTGALYAVLGPLVALVVSGHLRLRADAFLGLYFVGLVVSSYGILVRRRVFLLKRHDVRIKNLDPRLDGFTIAQLSDLHIGSLTPLSWGLRWSARSNEALPDLVVVTGDLATSGTAYHADIAEVIGSLKGKHGTVVSMGNHDYFRDGEPLIQRLRDKGARVLRNEGFVIDVDGALLFVAAADDTWTRRADVTVALAERPEGAPALLLAHDPALFDEAVALRADLVLSGHTHGGQIAIPYFAKRYSLSMFAHRYNLGFYRKDASTLYVHPGLGTTGPPIRIGVAPAVVLLTLRRA